MGLIAKGVESMMEEYNYCLEASRRVDTKGMWHNMCHFVYECFSLLKPLSHRLTCIAKEKDTEIIVGNWIRYKRPWEKLGSLVTGYITFFFTINDYGEKIKGIVREQIAEEF